MLGSIATLLMAVQTAPAFTQIEMLDQVVAIVDDDVILASELKESLETVRATLEARDMEMPDEEVLVRETLDRPDSWTASRCS
jgi:peptidyl-prolyl cis-trans isomerase SurA